MKRIISWLVCLAMLVSLAPAALAESIVITETPESTPTGGFWENLGKLLDEAGGNLSGAISEGWESAKEGFGTLAEAAGEWFAESAEVLRGYADEFGAWANEKLGPLWGDVKQAATGLWQSFLEGLAQVIGKVVSLFIDEEEVNRLFEEISPVVDLYAQEFAHAYAKRVALIAIQEHLSLTPEEETALSALNAYKACLDDNWTERVEAVTPQVNTLNDWLAANGQDQKAFEKQVTNEAETATMRKFYGAMVATTVQYAGERDLSLPENLVECLQDMSDYADGTRQFDEARRDEITETVNAWLTVNDIDEEAYLSALFSYLLEG